MESKWGWTRLGRKDGDKMRCDSQAVRGSVKSSEWGIATWMDAGQSHDLVVSGGFGDKVKVGASFSIVEESSSTAQYRFGPC